MGRDTYRYRKLDEEREKRKQLNPIWRGVGCLVIGVFAVLGYLFADWFVRANAINNWIYIPRAVLYPEFAPFLGQGRLLKLVVGFLFMLLTYGILSVIYAVAFPPKPGEFDAPPPKKQKRPKRRKS